MYIVVLNSPRLGRPSQTYCEVVILSNDFASGIIEFAKDSFEVWENDTQPFIGAVTRGGGTYGLVYFLLFCVPGFGWPNYDFYF